MAQRSDSHPASLRYIDQWTLTARLLLSDKNDRERLGLRWSFVRELPGAPVRQDFYLYDRLGRTVLAVTEDESGARLKQSRMKHRQTNASDLASLIEANTGFLIPAEQLARWILALSPPNDQVPRTEKAYPYGEWSVEYLAFADFSGWVMPASLRVYSDELELEITVTNWILPALRSHRPDDRAAPEAAEPPGARRAAQAGGVATPPVGAPAGTGDLIRTAGSASAPPVASKRSP